METGLTFATTDAAKTLTRLKSHPNFSILAIDSRNGYLQLLLPAGNPLDPRSSSKQFKVDIVFAAEQTTEHRGKQTDISQARATRNKSEHGDRSKEEERTRRKRRT